MGRSIKPFSAGALAMAALALSSPVTAKDAKVLEPSSAWNVDFGDSKCRLARSFGEGANKHYLFFEVWGPRNRFGFTAAGPGFKRFRSGKDVWVTFGSSQKPRKTTPFLGDLGSAGPAVIYTSLGLRPRGEQTKSTSIIPRLDSEHAAKVDTISFKQGGREVDFAITNLDDAFKVLNQCAEQMITVWGLDLEQHRTAQKRPVWTNEDVIGRRIGSRYPSSALNRGEQGIVRLRVIIDENGRVSDCVIDKSTTTEVLESPACEAMRHAIFEPGLDQSGKPMRSYFLTTITYKMSPS